MTTRELIIFVGVSASVGRNKEKAQALAIGTRRTLMLDKAPDGNV